MRKSISEMANLSGVLMMQKKNMQLGLKKNGEIPRRISKVRRRQADIAKRTGRRFRKEWIDYILAGLGQMYVMDERFTKNMDKFKPGTAQLISDAMAVYCR